MDKVRKQRIEKVKEIIEVIKIILENQELETYIIESLYNLIWSNNCQFFASVTTGEYFSFANSETSDIFSISFSPNLRNCRTISTEKRYCKAAFIEQKEIMFDEEYIRVKENFTRVYSDTNGSMSKVMLEKKERTYKNNQLRYSNVFNSVIDLRINKSNSINSIETLYITEDRRGMKKIESLAEGSGIMETYSKTDYCNELDFNTKEIKQFDNSYEMSKATKEEYEEFVLAEMESQKEKKKQ